MKEDEILNYFKNGVQMIPRCGEAESIELLSKSRAGDQNARKRLIEGHLYLVLEMAEEYAERGCVLPAAELIAEGNVALTAAVHDNPEGPLVPYLTEQIRSRFDEAVASQDDADAAAGNIAAQLNVLSEVTTRLADELGREATLEETARAMKMDEGDVKVLMKMALSAVNRNP